MRITSATLPNEVYYNRTLTHDHIRYEATAVAPHVLTVRATYTVATDTEAIFEGGSVAINRSAVAATRSFVYGAVQINPGIGVWYDIVRCMADGNAVGNGDQAQAGTQVHLRGGHQVRIITENDDTAGTVDFFIGALIQTIDEAAP